MIIKKQQGISAIGFLLVLIIGIFIVTLVIKTVPSYLENQTLESVLKDIAETMQGKEPTAGDLRKTLNKRLSVNNIKTVNSTDVQILDEGNKHIIIINYEVQKPLFANLSILMNFSERQEVLH